MEKTTKPRGQDEEPVDPNAGTLTPISTFPPILVIGTEGPPPLQPPVRSEEHTKHKD